ncbi:MAG: hypothetical protein ABEJ80_05225 [Halarchaeum sp.]
MSAPAYGGELVFSRVVTDLGDALAHALDASLSGYAVVAPADALLLGEGGETLVGFDAGVPTHVRGAAGDVGPPAVGALARAGPHRVRLYAGGTPSFAPEAAVPPDALAERAAGDPTLAERSRERAPEGPEEAGLDAVEAFLADEERVEAVREAAREDALAAASDLGLADDLVEP